MADENVTEPKNTTENAGQTTKTTPQPQTGAEPTAVPSPANIKHHALSPAAFAKKKPAHHNAAPAAHVAYSDEDVKQAESFGRVDDNGTVYVKDGDGEREVGQFPDASKEEALALYARRFLDLKEKLDVFANRLKSNTIKPHEIDESVKLLGEETKEPAVVGDVAELCAQFEQLKKDGDAKKEELANRRKEAVAKAVQERTAIVEKAEAVAAGLGDNTNWRSTADKFRALFDEWQAHQRDSVRIDRADADALLRRAHDLQPAASQVGASSRQRARACQDREGSDHRRGERDPGFHRLGGNLPQVQRTDGPLEESRSRRPQR